MAVRLDGIGSRFGAGQPVRRVEDFRLMTGAGRYTDDLSVPGMTWLAVLRSPHAHARIKSLEIADAKAMPGVVACYTAADLEAENVGHFPTIDPVRRPDGSAMAYVPRYPLATDTVRFVGEPIACVVAETRQQAIDAVERIAVEYEELPAIVDLRAAVEPGAPVICPAAPDNISAQAELGAAAEVAAAFAKASHITRVSLVNQRLVANPLEPRASLAIFDAGDGRLTLHTGNQSATNSRQAMAEAILKMPVEKLRYVVGDIGGGFGMKAGNYPEDVLVCFAARKLKRPVKWRADRSEEFQASLHGRDQVTDAEMALDAESKILAARAVTLANMGGYVATIGAIIPLMLGPLVTTCVYHVPQIHLTQKAVLTNMAPMGAYRGAGRPESVYIIERLMDLAGRETGLGQAEIRRRNLVPPSAMPYTTSLNQVYDSGDFPRLLQQVLDRAEWQSFGARKAAAKQRGKLRGIGLAGYVEWTGAMALSEKVDVAIHGDGKVFVYSGTQAMGQGLETSYAQLTAAALGIDIEHINIVQGDTDVTSGYGSVGSRSLFVGGSAVEAGARAGIEKGRELASGALEVDARDIVYRDGNFNIAGTDRSIGLFDLARRQPGGMFMVTTVNEVAGSSWPNGFHVCEVEIDPDTGAIEIVRYTTMDDVGNAINPMIVAGQLHGGIAQGVGQALLEQAVYDPDNGQLITGSYMDYCMPRADDLPMFDFTIDQSVPCKTNPLGAKGCGESGAVCAPPVVVNAVVDALAEFGVRHIDMPVTAEKVWQAIARGRA
ncbi:MAG: xanthine dehydrogenase family protein molybdopterin-binding subunit [Alphaproteobacteria bacterium]